MHKVEVDDEVFALVQKNAEPLVDSFNSALRRILAGIIGKRRLPVEASSLTGSEMCEVPPGMPQALWQILDVVRLVHRGGRTRRDATRQVAARLAVTPQTVIDKYTRQLGLTAAEFDRLLAAAPYGELQKRLHSNFPEHVDVIDKALGANILGQDMPNQETLVDIADRLFGPEHGAELAIPRRGTAPHRPPPDLPQSERGL